MIKHLSVIVLVTASLFAQNFDEFLDNAIKNSPYLKASNLNIAQAKQSGEALTRYANPSLYIEASNFNADLNQASNDTTFGYSAAYTQPIRLWGVGNDKDALSLAMKKSASSLYSRIKAKFTQQISLAYIRYANQKQRLLLGKQELAIAKNIYNISNERYKAGTISKGVVLQAQVDYEMVKVRIHTLRLTNQRSYYQLLKSAGINKEIAVDTGKRFSINNSTDLSNNPDLQYIKTNQTLSLAEAQVNSNKIEWLSLGATYESEPGQDIYRIGASIPLAIFNTKSQEKAISQLEATKSQLSAQNTQNVLEMELVRLQKQEVLLKELKSFNEKTLVTQRSLLKLFEEGYKIANVNLLQFQSIKNNVIETQENIINLETALDQNAINFNYISGAYND